MTVLEWGEPPPGQRNRGFWVSILTELQSRPNEWAVVYQQQDGESAQTARSKVQSLVALAKRRGVSLEYRTVAIDDAVVAYARVV